MVPPRTQSIASLRRVRLGGRGMYRDTVISLTTNPSFVSSAWIRGAPQPSWGHRARRDDESRHQSEVDLDSADGRSEPSVGGTDLDSTGRRVGVHDNEPARPRWPRASERNPECSVRVPRAVAGGAPSSNAVTCCRRASFQSRGRLGTDTSPGSHGRRVRRGR